MAKRWRQYSFTDQQNYFRKVRVVLIWVFAFFVIHTFGSSLLVSNRVVENNTMRPGIERGERFVFLSLTLQHMFRDKSAGSLPFERGDIVLVDRNRGSRPLTRIVLDWFARFFTLQRYSLFPSADTLFVKRIIGLPGDTVSMENYVIRVKPAGQTYEFTEFEVSNKDYILDLPRHNPGWDTSLPFSGYMERVTLGPNECFVLSDDRGSTNDSRTWGPVPAGSVTSRALIRYWPLTRFGTP